MLALVLAACGGPPAAQSPEPGGASAAPAATPAAEKEATPAGGAEAASAGGAPADSAAAQPEPDSKEFKTLDTHTAKETHGVEASKLAPTKKEALIKLLVVDKEKGPIKGIVVTLTGADGKKFYAPESDATGYAEVLVPNGQTYEVVYLSLGHKDIAATTTVDDKPNLRMKLTLRYTGFTPPRSAKADAPGFVLDGVNFDTGKATIRKDSFPRLDGVVEYLQHKKSARIEISGHTDNVGNAKTNKTLSEKRAQSCRDYVISKGIEAARVTAVGYGDERPMAPNDTEAGRQQNRRIEAAEL